MNKNIMLKALAIAKKSKKDIPIGAIIVKNNEILAFAHNKKEVKNNPTKHAEMIVIEKASKKLQNWRLDDCDLYVTLEPCPMCAWAILQSRIKNVYFGSFDNLYGAFGSKIDLRKLANSKLNVIGGICEDECNEILQSYFKNVRNKQNDFNNKK